MTQSVEGWVLAFAIAVSIIYIFLGCIARSHVPPERKSDLSRSAPTYFYYWPFYGDLFTRAAIRLRSWGWFLFTVMVISYVAAFVLAR